MMSHEKKCLYEKLYEEIKQDIQSGRLKSGARLPSKRSQAERLGISVITVESAYEQLIAEGYISARERSGYFVCDGEFTQPELQELPEEQFVEVPQKPASVPGSSMFPFSVWTRLMRTVILEKGNALLYPVPPGGAPDLQQAISAHLKAYRGISVPPHRIIVGAGTEYLNNLLVQLLGNNLTYAVEDPGYHKPAKIYRLNGALCLPIGLDSQGLSAEELYYKNVDVVHISPAHHFPTGIVMPISRRMELVKWAVRKNGYIIEDDYDSEFRWAGKPLPTMFGLDKTGRVIYMNTFSMTIAPSVRISYVCLPPELYERWRERLGFCSCPVPAFEQYTLASFISSGHFERHISRMRKHYRHVRELALALAEKYCGREHISEESAGLHFLLDIPEGSPVTDLFTSCGIRLSPLSGHYDEGSNIPPDTAGRFVVNYSAADIGALAAAGK